MKNNFIYFIFFTIAFVVFGLVNRQQETVASESYTFVLPKEEIKRLDPLSHPIIKNAKVEEKKVEVAPAPVPVIEPLQTGPCVRGLCGVGQMSYSPSCNGGSCDNSCSSGIVYHGSGFRSGSCGGGWYPGKVLRRIFRR